MPLCFGALGSVRASSAPHCEYCAAVVQIFWPVIRQPPSTLVALVVRLGQVGTRARLGKQLAPDHLAAEGRRQEPLLLLVGAERDDRRDDPRRDAHRRAACTRPVANSWAMMICSIGLDARPHGLGRCGMHPAALGDRGVALLTRNRFERGDFRADLLAAASRSPGRDRCRSCACPVLVAMSTTCCG